TEKPSPNRAFMGRPCARAKTNRIDWLVIGSVRRQRTQPDRNDQFFFHDVNNRSPALRIENWMIERNCEELIRPAGNVECARLTFAINHVIEITAVREPEALIE